MKIYTCTTCRRRIATFFKRASGEKLCPQCFIKGFIKSIQRTISRHELLGPWDNILIFIDPYIPYISIGLALAMGIVESKFNTKIYALIPKAFSDEELESIVKIIEEISKHKEINVITSNEEYECIEGNMIKTFLKNLNYIQRALNKTQLSKLKASLPYTIELLTYLHLKLWFNGLHNLIKYVLPKFKLNDSLEMIYPFYGTFLDEVVYFNYLNGVYKYQLSPCSKLINVRSDALYKLVQDIALHNIELLYSNLMIIENLI